MEKSALMETPGLSGMITGIVGRKIEKAMSGLRRTTHGSLRKVLMIQSVG